MMPPESPVCTYTTGSGVEPTVYTALTFSYQSFGEYKADEIGKSLLESDDVTTGDLICNPAVRRLTPLECERLQGFPDGWTDIGAWKDSKGRVRETSDAARYKALGNSILEKSEPKQLQRTIPPRHIWWIYAGKMSC